MSDTFKTSLPLRSAEDPDPAIGAVLKPMHQNMGMIPNMYAGMANLPALLDTYSHGYQKFRAESGFTPAEQEVVFLTISRANECHYCVAAHSMAADTMSKVPAEVTEAIRNDAPAPDAKLEALRTFTSLMVQKRGNPSPAEANAFLVAGYEEKQILAIVLAIGVKVFSNYTNHIFHTELDEGFSSRRWSPPG